MDDLLITLTKKHLNIDVDDKQDKNYYPRTKLLPYVIELLCYLIQSRTKRIPEEKISRNRKLNDLLKDIRNITTKVNQRTYDLREQRSNFINFQRKAEKDWGACVFTKNDAKENVKRVFAIKAAEFSSEMLATNLKNDTQKASIEKEINLIEFRLMTMSKIYRLKENDLYNARFETKKRCLEQLAKYDDDIGTLYNSKIVLLIEKDNIEEEYTDIRNQLEKQRALYDQLQEERELASMKAFLEKLINFSRNHAAKIIQRNWRLHCIRMPSKKRKGRK